MLYLFISKLGTGTIVPAGTSLAPFGRTWRCAVFESVLPPSLGPELRWSYHHLDEQGRVDVRWVGPVHGVISHHAGTTKPCRAELTGGALECPLCATKIGKRWRGYAPALHFNSKRLVFVVGQTCGEKLLNFERGKCYTFGRGRGLTAPVDAYPYQGLSSGKFDPRFGPGGEFAEGADLWPWLLRLWQDVELEQVYRKLTGKLL